MNKKLLDYFGGDELAANVWKSKYAAEGEETPEDMHRRMAKEFARIERKYGTNQFEENKHLLSDFGRKVPTITESEIFDLFKDFKYLVPQGSIMSTLGTGVTASLSNCFVIESPVDSYSGILKSDADLVHYFKRRGGVGVDISNLRPNGVPTKNTAKTSTGAVSFMERFSNTCREVAQSGRRGRA